MSPYDYAAYYCEENVWRLLSRPEYRDRGEAYALFMFGAAGNVAVFGQKAGDPARGGLVFWDYHVAALDLRAGIIPRVLDFDSTAGVESPAGEYLDRSFGTAGAFPRALLPFRPLFRLVPAPAFASRFESDRSHMLLADGSYAAAPPPWAPPAPAAGGAVLRLPALLDPLAPFPDLPNGGEPLDLDGLRAFLPARFISPGSGERR